MQAELQSEGDGAAEGEDAVVEEAAVTGTRVGGPLGSYSMLTCFVAPCALGRRSAWASGSLLDSCWAALLLPYRHLFA